MEKCKWCAKGDKPEMLDDDGVKCSITNKPGKLSHAFDDAWWDCGNACSCNANFHKIYCCWAGECEYLLDVCVHCGKSSDKYLLQQILVAINSGELTKRRFEGDQYHVWIKKSLANEIRERYQV